jgi:molybdopterin molybdotransferase
VIEVEAARDAVLKCAAPLTSEEVPLRGAFGRVLAEEACSAEPVPSFDNSAMDGFAVRAEDTRGATTAAPVALRIADESRAGRPAAVPVGAHEAVRISTGAMVPIDADAIVPVEDTRIEKGRVLVESTTDVGRYIRHAGDDIGAGELVLSSGTLIGPAELGVLSSLGRAVVRCHRRPRVHVLTSGDELLGPDEPMRPGGVRDANGYSIPALAEQAGAELVGIGSVADDPAATRAAVASALDADIAVLCGGVSVGEHDHVKDALAAVGVEQRFWGVALKPGRPTWFGTRDGALVFGLPGNPVSAMVTFVLFVRPALVALAGGRPQRRRTIAKLARDYEKDLGRAHALRCRLEFHEDGWHAHPYELQGSHVLTSMLGADCLAWVPTKTRVVRAGEPVEVELLGGG